ncbi:MAG: hypothetical protein C0462_00045 [Alcanivorax sp.]|nr:hypothetical protein [Alcanivorax sp.]
MVDQTFGCCEECGCTIPETRLSRYPTVTVCADCAETREEEVHKGWAPRTRTCAKGPWVSRYASSP